MKTYVLIGLIFTFVFSATNDSTIDSATLKRIFMGNYSYNTCISSQPILTMRWASDLNRPVFKNRTGTLYKALMDASTTSNTPRYRVFVADSNGHASSTSAYTYTNGNLHAPYFTGDSTVVTGKVKGTSGSFSGKVTATDLQVSDSVKAVSGSFSNLTSGYAPYQNSTGTLINSPIFTNGTNASIGKSSVESWGVSQRAMQVGGNTAIMGNAAESGSNFTWLLNNAYYDGAWKPYSNGSTSSFRIGATGILFEHDTGLTADIGYSPTTRLSWTLSGGLNVTNKIVSSDSIKGVVGAFSGALTGTTLNTGNGANELYAMNQNTRTTDAVTFKKTNTELLSSDSVNNSGCITTAKFNLNSASNQPWASTYSILNLRGFGSVYGSPNTSGYPTGSPYGQVGITNNSYYDGVSKAIGAGSSSGIQLGQGHIDFSTADSVAAGGTQTFVARLHIFRDTTTAKIIKADSIKLTKSIDATDFRASDSIKGVNALFTGRITSTTLHASDTVKSEYGRFSNIIADGDGVRFNTKNEVSFIYKDSINDNTIFGCKYSPGDGNVASVVLSNFTLDSTLVTRTDSVIVKKFVAKSIKSTSLNTDTLKINSNIFDYSSGSIDLTMYGFASSPTSVSFSYVKIGNVVTLKSNIATYSTSNSGEFYFAGLPSNITPSSLVTFASVPKNAFSDNSAIVTSPVTAKITSSGGLYLYLGNSLSGGWTSSGNKGYQTFNITYSL